MGHENRVTAGLICDKDLGRIREAVCIQTEKVYDSCREKDCIENAKVLFKDPERMQKLIRKAINVKARRAEVVDVVADVEEVPFKRGFFTVDVKFFIRVILDFFVPRHNGGVHIIEVAGIVVFDKKVVLFGSEGNIKIFKSKFREEDKKGHLFTSLQQDNLPIAKVEVAEPIALNAHIQDILDKLFDDFSCEHLPQRVVETIDDVDVPEELLGADEDIRGEGRHIPLRRVVATIGIFTIIKLVRLVQLLIPAFDFCVPFKECIASTNQNPCELFETIEFPVDEFFPPQKFDFPGALEHEQEMIEEMQEHHHHHGKREGGE